MLHEDRRARTFHIFVVQTMGNPVRWSNNWLCNGMATCAKPKYNHRVWWPSAPPQDNHWNGSIQAEMIYSEKKTFEIMKVRPAYRGEIVFRFRTRMLAEAVLQDSAIADAFGPLVILGRDFLRRLTQES